MRFLVVVAGVFFAQAVYASDTTVDNILLNDGSSTDITVNAGDQYILTGSGTSAYAGWIYNSSTLNLAGSGTVVVQSNGISVGRTVDGNSSDGYLNLSGSITLDLNQPGYTNLMVGYGGGQNGSTGTVIQSDNSQVIIGSNWIVGYNGGTGNYILQDNSVLKLGGAGSSFIYVGDNDQNVPGLSTSGVITVKNNAQLIIDGAGNDNYTNFFVGTNGGTGAGGPNGGSGTINQQDNSYVHLGGAQVAFGEAVGSVGVYNLQSGTLELTASQQTVFGSADSSRGELNQSGGYLTSTGARVIFGNSGTGIYNLSDGFASFDTGIYLGANGAINQTGGLLQTGGANAITGSGTYNIYQGILQVSGSDLSSGIAIALHASDTTSTGFVVNTNGYNATLSGNITTDGVGQFGAGGNAFTKYGSGTLTLSGNSRDFNTFAVLGGAVNQTAGVSTGNEFAIGSGTGMSGSYTLSSGTLVVNPTVAADGTTPVAGSIRVGDFGGSGTFNQSGGRLVVTDNSAFNVGNQGGNGVYNLDGGVVELNDGLHVIGRSGTGNPASQGVVNVNSGTFILQNNASLTLGNNLKSDDSQGVFNQNGGVVSIALDSRLYLSSWYANSGTTGIYNLNGGVLQIGGNSLRPYYNSSQVSQYAFNFGSGTIQVTGSALNTSADLTLQGGEHSVIDSNGYGANFSGNIIGEGEHQIDYGGNSLEIVGSGTVILSGSTRVFDSFFANAGNVKQTAGNSSAVEMAVGSGSGATGSFTLSGGTLTINPSTKTDNSTLVAGSFRVGDWGGSGTFNQTGGTLVLSDSSSFNIGNQGGNGVFNLSGGETILNGGLHIVGRSDTGKPDSTGVINVSGGDFIVQSTGKLILGNNLKADNSSATFNQTGGLVTIGGSASLYLSAYSNGGSVYNLTSGTLQVGGSSLKAHYGNTNADYQFNLGGGVIQVYGSDLVTDALPTLVNGSVSTFDSGAYNATFTKGFDGAGGFSKIGSGYLTFGGSNTLLADSSVEGMLAIGGTTGSGVLNIGSGVTLTVQAQNVATGPISRLIIGHNGNGTLNLDGGLINVTSGTNLATLAIGRSDSDSIISNGVLNMTSGTISIQRSVISGSNSPGYGTLAIGSVGAGSSGVMNQSGGLVQLDNSNLVVGAYGASGTYNLSGDAVLIGTHSGQIQLAYNESSGVINVNDNAQFTWNGGAYFGGYDDGSGDTGAMAIFNQNGAGSIVTFNNTLTLGFQAGNTGIYNLNAGTLRIGGGNLRQGNGTANFNLGGGTLQVIGSDLNTLVAPNFVASTTSTIDTGSYNAVLRNGFTGNGSFAKTGSGALTLGGTSTLNTAASVEGDLVVGGTAATGSLNLGEDARLNIQAQNTSGPISRLRVGYGGTGNFNLDGGVISVTSGNSNAYLNVGESNGTRVGSGTFTMTSGTIDIQRSSTDASGYVNLRVGSGTGSYGVFNQSGGVVNIQSSNLQAGANGATGLIHLDGTAVVNGDATSQIQLGDPYGAGTIQISGSSQLNWDGGSYLGWNDGSPVNPVGGNGTITQDGDGSVATFNGSLVLGFQAGSHGTYNLNAGTMQIGGNHLIQGAGTGQFNLGGGALRIVGSNLATSVNTSLTNSATSTVNTNGFNATFNSDISGNGSLRKTGNGILTVKNVSATGGTLSVEQGTLAIQANGNVGLGVLVNSGAVLTISKGANTVATINLSAGLSTEAGSILQFTISSSASDLINVSGGINLADGTVFQFTGITGIDLGIDHTWTLIVDQDNGPVLNLSGISIGSIAGTLSSAPVGQFALAEDGNNVQLVYTAAAVPEPQTWFLLILGCVILVIARKKFVTGRNNR
ncbi:MAG: hypothetical protein LBH01_03375 [Verrucomicrobiales bacterium]|jgi:autotransporter-associated beta strand protein|nr:hypothetical protein [Verrucomicrobiales bacterium]